MAATPTNPTPPRQHSPSVQQKPVSVPSDNIAQSIASAKSDASVKSQASAPVKDNYVRTLNSQDISKALLQLQKPVTPQNKQILTTMLLYGIETSSEAFDMIETTYKSKGKGNTIEGAVVSYSKGLGVNTKSVDLISQFLSQGVPFSEALAKASQSMEAFRSFLAGTKGGGDSALIAGISGFLGEFLDEFKVLKKRLAQSDFKGIATTEGELARDLTYLQQFLAGLNTVLSGKSDSLSLEIQQKMMAVKEQAGALQDALATHMILTTNPENRQVATDFYHYFQVPNPMAAGASDMDVLISKDPENKKRVNPENTKIVITCETTELGVLTISVEVNQKKVATTIYSSQQITQQFVVDTTPEFKTALEELDFEVTGVRVLKQVLNIQKLLLPTVDLGEITRVSTEA